MQKAGVFNRLDTVVLRVRDVKRARAWYEQKLGLNASYEDEKEKLVVFDLGGTTSLTLWQLKIGDRFVPSGSAGTFPIFAVDDVEATQARMKNRGVVVSALRGSGAVHYFTFQDPDGNHLEACQVEG